MSHHINHKPENLIHRINRIEGQIGGVKKMIEGEMPYDQVIIQLNSIRAALQKISQIVFEADIQHSLIRIDEGSDLNDEFARINRLLVQYSKVK